MQPGMNSDFETFRRERNMRRRQVTSTERPAGNKDVWAQLEAKERSDLQDQILNAEVDDFFADATRLAADIVKRVADNREEEVSEKLISEMEEFLFESIRHATNMVRNLDCDVAERTGAAEATLAANMKNLDGPELDEFRAEGTAQLRDKHFGQDPFSADLDVSGGERQETASEDLSSPRMQISEGELALDFGSDTNEEFAAPEFESGFSAVEDPGESEPFEPTGELEMSEPEADSERDDLPLAALYDADGELEAEHSDEESEHLEPAADEEPEDLTEAPPSASGEDRERVRAALLLLVKQGVMTKDQARAAYRARVESGV